jgi:hypothetical protein
MGNSNVNVSMENSHFPFSDRRVVSIEEEMMADAEASDLMRSVSDNMYEANRVSEVSQSLLDMTVVAQGIKEATPTELALMETVGDMACAGTDVPPEVIVPQLESYLGKQISVEGIKTSAKAMVVTIQKIVNKIWEAIKQFFRHVYSKMFPNIAKRAEIVKKDVEEVKHTAKKLREGAKVSVDSAYMQFVIDNKFCKTESEILSALDKTETAAEYVFRYYAKAVIQRGEAIINTISRIDDSKVEQQMVDFTKVMTKIPFPDIPSASQRDKPGGVASDYIKQSVSMLGNLTLNALVIDSEIALFGKLTPEVYSQARDGAELEVKHNAYALAIIGGEHVELVDSFPNESSSHRESEIEALSIQAMEKINAKMMDLMMMAENFEKTHYQAMIHQQEAIDTVTARLSNKPSTDDIIDSFRVLANYNRFYAHWVESPAMKMIRSITQITRAMTFITERSLALYE